MVALVSRRHAAQRMGAHAYLGFAQHKAARSRRRQGIRKGSARQNGHILDSEGKPGLAAKAPAPQHLADLSNGLAQRQCGYA